MMDFEGAGKDDDNGHSYSGLGRSSNRGPAHRGRPATRKQSTLDPFLDETDFLPVVVIKFDSSPCRLSGYAQDIQKERNIW
jgi:hypothetical protein